MASSPLKNKDAPAFDFYPERWAHGTRHLSKTERCDFLDLLAVQWTEDGIVDDLLRIAKMLGYRRAAQIPEAVLEKFPVAADGRRRHPFLEKLRAEQRERIASRRRGARITNQKRWNATPPEHAAAESREGCDPMNAPDDALALSDRSATAGRVASESPPPTTHHPPQRNIRSSGGGHAQARDGATLCYPTLAEVQSHGALLGASPECSEAFWQECEAVRWVNKHGVPIADWRPLLARFRTRWQAIESQSLGRSRDAPGAHADPANPSPAKTSPFTRHRHAHANSSRNPAVITGELNRPGRYASPAPRSPAASPSPPGAAPAGGEPCVGL